MSGIQEEGADDNEVILQDLPKRTESDCVMSARKGENWRYQRIGNGTEEKWGRRAMGGGGREFRRK